MNTTPLPLQPEEEEVVSVQDDISQVTGDPIQQLFTTLGKFHRQLNKAQHSPDGAGWCDECMNELMVGLEISIAREWTPIKDALIDTARILHSYEEAGRAGQCVPFLKDSYELLSLMVGDLIVDTVRAGVKQKWREHYTRAVAELESRGITLVEDEDHEVVAHSPAAAAVKPPEPAKVSPAPVSEVREEPSIPEILEQPEEPEDEAETVATPGDTPEAASEKLAAKLDDMEIELPPLSDEYSQKTPDTKTEKAGDIVPFPFGFMGDETPYEEPQQLDVLEDRELFTLDAVETPAEIVEKKEKSPVTVEYDTLFPDGEKPESAPMDKGAVAAEPEKEKPEAEKPTEELPKKDEAPTEESPPQDTTDEILHDANAGKSTDAVEAVQEKTPPTQESKIVREDADAHTALLQRVQAAISSGDTRNTKTMALELAVAMARLEYEQARQELAAAEQLLLETGRVIEQGEAKVTQMENDLLRAEELLAARDGERNLSRERIGAIDEELSGLSAGLADIDAQIAALQQKRVEQEDLIRNKQAERGESIDAESRIQTELEELGQELDSIRDNLEKANGDVRRHHVERRNIELDIIKAKEEMEGRCQSLSIIENTLHAGSAAPVKVPESDTLL